MYRVVVSLVLLLLVATGPFVACPVQNVPHPPEPASNAVPPDTVIVLYRGACESRCSVYRLIVFADGRLIWDGISYVHRFGVVLSEIDTRVIKELLAAATAIDFFDLKNGYGVRREFGMSNDFEVSDEKCNSSNPDGPIAMLTISAGGRSKTVVNNRACKGPIYDKLNDLEDRIDATANSARWILRVPRKGAKATPHRNNGLFSNSGSHAQNLSFGSSAR